MNKRTKSMTTGPIQTQNPKPPTTTVTISKKAKTKSKKPATHAFPKVRKRLHTRYEIVQNPTTCIFQNNHQEVKGGQCPEKVPFDICDAQPWDNGDKIMEYLPMHPCTIQGR
jgi:hypothetical protein